MKRVEFTLGMPGRSSWNGRWSGEGTHYAIVRTMTDEAVEKLLKNGACWSYSFGDGWCASVRARVVPKGERLKKSAGFCGYNWMVASIVVLGEIRTPDEWAAARGEVTP